MKTYEAMDALILEAISCGRSPLYDKEVSREAFRLAEATNRAAFRVIDGRLQALRSAARIKHLTGAAGRGWVIVKQGGAA